jgi:hypothetical protein
VDCNYFRQQCDYEQSVGQIAQNLVTQGEADILQLQTKNQETTAESNANQDRITTLQNELNHEHANAKGLEAAVVAHAAFGQQPYV